jgi:hypothetical protein
MGLVGWSFRCLHYGAMLLGRLVFTGNFEGDAFRSECSEANQIPETKPRIRSLPVG